MLMERQRDEEKAQQERASQYVAHLSRMFNKSNPMGGKEDTKFKKAREDFEKNLRGEGDQTERKEIGPSSKKYEWDEDIIDFYKARQKKKQKGGN